MSLTPEELKDLKLKANQIRKDVIEMVTLAGSGHTGGPLGMADIFAAMYFKILKFDSENPDLPERDRLILSNGHICPVLYATMARAGFFPIEELKTLRKLGSRLQGHPHRTALPGLETTSGPLGSGLSQAAGMAYIAQKENLPFRVYCLTSDGEHDEGNTWEAAMFAGKNKLHKLIAVMDRNNIQIDGYTEDIMPMGDIKGKYESFGWNVIEVDGHNMEQFLDAIFQAQSTFEKPTMIIAHTIPGKGVSFMENRFEWHGVPPDIQDVEGAPKKGEQAKAALEELNNIEEQIKKGE